MTEPRMLTRYRIIVEVKLTDSEFDKAKTNCIKVFNQRRIVGNTKREYKLTARRLGRFTSVIRSLWVNGRADPDMGKAYTWGIDPMEDPTLTQDQEWPFK